MAKPPPLTPELWEQIKDNPELAAPYLHPTMVAGDGTPMIRKRHTEELFSAWLEEDYAQWRLRMRLRGIL